MHDTLAVCVAKFEGCAATWKKVGTMTLNEFLTDRYDDHLLAHGRSGTRNSDNGNNTALGYCS
ncbi:hypothetical protein BRPE64_CCDS00400 [Caballeronia insecticola]|uniref:Uncharacterized protein n=1 Tax=Caballeronia insecticola TaxID=758793 RepID=R4WNA6_9BURK|nr:hypothetical protein BRPE64_CCDS00400 [Caballeronia insecticola]